jgi:type II secretion system (T2SS) protein E
MPRLGQLLLRSDFVTENNLARALGVQQFAGGRLGTLLLERGSVNEDDLGKTLALQHGCEAVAWRLLADVPSTTIAALPAKFAIKHSAIPYDRTESAIRIALRDPADLRILDELFFVTGRKIIPGVAPEARIYQALEKYYGERRTPRYAILAEKLSRPARPARGPAAPPPPPSFYPDPSRAAAPAPEPAEIWGDSSDHDLASGPAIVESWSIPEARGGWAGTASPARSTGEVEAISWEDMPPGPSLWSQDVGAPSAPPSGAPAAPPSVPPAPVPAPLPGMPAARDFTAVGRAKDRDSIAVAAIAALSTRFEKAALFAVRPDGVAGWAAGGNVDARGVRAISIPWTEASVFLNVRLSRSFYLGPLLRLPRHEPLAQALGQWPEECVLMPVLIREKPVAFLYAEAVPERGVTPIDLVYLRELAEAVAAAFAESIRLKKKEI